MHSYEYVRGGLDSNTCRRCWYVREGLDSAQLSVRWKVGVRQSIFVGMLGGGGVDNPQLRRV